MMLRLSDAGRLPTLANHCFIVGEAKRADVIWSEGDFKTLCEHMLNENPLSHFLNVWIDANGKAQFTKAPVWSRADRRANWAWATIIGKAKAKQGLVSIHQIPKASHAGLRLILMLTTGNTSKRGNGRYKPFRYYSKIRSFTLSFARQVMAFTYSLSLGNCILSASGSCC